MSYGVSAALQVAIFGLLEGDPAVAASGAAVFDTAPPGDAPPLFVVLGAEESFARNDKTGTGALHRFTISVVSEDQGFLKAKLLAGAVSDVQIGRAHV